MVLMQLHGFDEITWFSYFVRIHPEIAEIVVTEHALHRVFFSFGVVLLYARKPKSTLGEVLLRLVASDLGEAEVVLLLTNSIHLLLQHDFFLGCEALFLLLLAGLLLGVECHLDGWLMSLLEGGVG